ncbi:hypothetical protein D0T53_11825 [Dysgonomonas sp. 216]|nr:hypothetical protein [Dysgonomonas sp. 216]
MVYSIIYLAVRKCSSICIQIFSCRISTCLLEKGLLTFVPSTYGEAIFAFTVFPAKSNVK